MVFLAIVFAAVAHADEAADRAAIQRVIETLNAAQSHPGAQRPADLFTPDAENEMNKLRRVGRRMTQMAREPWSETTPPHIVLRRIRFVTPDVALADGGNTQFGSVILVRSIPVLLVMKKEGQDWRIAALRVMVELANLL